jgi:hypothetical protein
MSENQKAYEEKAISLLIGAKIVSVEPMNEDDTFAYGWADSPFVITLDNGVEINAQMDPEGNGPGTLCIFDTEEGKGYML